MKKKQVCIIGNNSSATDKAITIAYETGKAVAQLDMILVCGGMGGIMESACKGAVENGGMAIGIIPGTDKSTANPYCTIVIPTGIGYARNMVNVLAGDLTVAIGGGAGTLNEIAYAWQFNKPVYAFKGIPGWADKLADTKIDEKYNGVIIGVDSVDNLIRKIKRDFNIK